MSKKIMYILCVIAFMFILSGCGDKTDFSTSFGKESINSAESYLAETEKPDSTPPPVMLANETYSIGDDKFDFTLGQKDDGYYITIICSVESKVSAFRVYAGIDGILRTEKESVKPIADVLTYMINVKDGTSILGAKNYVCVYGDSVSSMSAWDYFTDEWFSSEYQQGEDEEKTYVRELGNIIGDFIKNYWPKN